MVKRIVICAVILAAMSQFALYAVPTAVLTQLFTLQTDFQNPFVIMDSDSTICLYRKTGDSQMLVRRIHASGLIDPDQVLFTLPGIDDNTNNYAFYRTSFGGSNYFLFMNQIRLVIYVQTGDLLQNYLIEHQSTLSEFDNHTLTEDRLYYITTDANGQKHLNCWQFGTTNAITQVFDFHPQAQRCRVSKLSSSQVVISQMGPIGSDPAQFPVMLMDNAFNLSATNLFSKDINIQHSFNPTAHYAQWEVTGGEWGIITYRGIIGIIGSTLTLNIWMDGSYETNADQQWTWYFPFGLDLWVARHYIYQSPTSIYIHYRIYQSGSTNVVPYSGFPNIDPSPNWGLHVGRMNDNILIVHKANQEEHFRLVNLSHQSWIPVQGSPIPSQFLTTRYFNSDTHLFKIDSSYYHPTISGMRLDISTSADDLIAEPPKLLIHPNPFKQCVLFEYESSRQPTELVIYNIKGQKVIEIKAAEWPVQWDGKDAHGRETAPGIYFARIKGGNHKIQKMIKL